MSDETKKSEFTADWQMPVYGKLAAVRIAFTGMFREIRSEELINAFCSAFPSLGFAQETGIITLLRQAVMGNQEATQALLDGLRQSGVENPPDERD